MWGAQRRGPAPTRQDVLCIDLARGPLAGLAEQGDQLSRPHILHRRQPLGQHILVVPVCPRHKAEGSVADLQMWGTMRAGLWLQPGSRAA